MILVPIINQDLAWNCLASMEGKFDPADIVVVDNSRERHPLVLPFTPGFYVYRRQNLGVARSWNIGIRRALAAGQPLTVCSQSVAWGRRGAETLAESYANMDEWGAEYPGFSWHVNTFTVKFMETMGFFDENLFPAYMEDTDMLYRMGLCGLPSPRENGRHRPNFDLDATCGPDGAALNSGVVEVNFGRLERYYREKWGGNQQEEIFHTPFNSGKGVNWWEGVDYAGDH